MTTATVGRAWSEAVASISPKAGRALLIWEQHDQRANLPLRDEVRKRIPAACPVIRYPAVGMNAFWPFRTKDPRNAPEPGFPWGRYPIGDRVALKVAEAGLPGPRAFARYMELSRSAMPDVPHLLALERSVYAQRDATCDIVMSDFVFANVYDVHQFWTHGHLAIRVLSELLRRLLERSRDVLGDLDETARAELEAFPTIFSGQGDAQLSLHPLVIERLGLRFVDKKLSLRLVRERVDVRRVYDALSHVRSPLARGPLTGCGKRSGSGPRTPDHIFLNADTPQDVVSISKDLAFFRNLLKTCSASDQLSVDLRVRSR